MTASNQVDIPDFASTLDAMAPAPVAKPVFRVLVNFRKGPAFGMSVQAADEHAASAAVLKFARECGMNGTVKGRIQAHRVAA